MTVLITMIVLLIHVCICENVSVAASAIIVPEDYNWDLWKHVVVSIPVGNNDFFYSLGVEIKHLFKEDGIAINDSITMHFRFENPYYIDSDDDTDSDKDYFDKDIDSDDIEFDEEWHTITSFVMNTNDKINQLIRISHVNNDGLQTQNHSLKAVHGENTPDYGVITGPTTLDDLYHHSCVGIDPYTYVWYPRMPCFDGLMEKEPYLTIHVHLDKNFTLKFM
eukprot:494675_1